MEEVFCKEKGAMSCGGGYLFYYYSIMIFSPIIVNFITKMDA